MSRVKAMGLSVEAPGRRLLSDVCLEVAAGECVAVMGPSGSGKTTLLNCLSGIARPASGSIVVDGTDLTRLGASKRAAFRLRNVGLVFQFGELLPELSALENVALPMRLLGTPRPEAERRAGEWLGRLGLDGFGPKHPDSLSGGETQRVGIARALAHEPGLVLADEPTGALDEANASQVTGLLVGAATRLGAAVVLATHDPLVAARADRVLRLRETRLDPEGPPALSERGAR